MINTKENDDGSLVVSADIVYVNDGPDEESTGYYIVIDDETGESIGPFESAEDATNEFINLIGRSLGEDSIIDRDQIAAEILTDGEDDE